MNDHSVINDDDFILASFPRSGNTWLRFILANLMSGNEVGITFHNYHQYVPDIHFIRDFSEWRSYPPFPRVIKSHLLPQPEYKNIIYIVRDPRAAIISHWLYKGKPCELEQYILSDDIWPAVWNVHVGQWVNYSHSNNVLIVRYEEMLSNTEEQIRNILAFLGLGNIDQNTIIQAVERSSFERMRKIEKEEGFWRPLKGDEFMRRGKPDGWRKEVSQSILDKIIERNYEMMKYFNYI